MKNSQINLFIVLGLIIISIATVVFIIPRETNLQQKSYREDEAIKYLVDNCLTSSTQNVVYNTGLNLVHELEQNIQQVSRECLKASIPKLSEMNRELVLANSTDVRVRVTPESIIATMQNPFKNNHEKYVYLLKKENRVILPVDEGGIVKKDTNVFSSDNKMHLRILKGTLALDRHGNPLTNISVRLVSPWFSGDVKGVGYELNPSGAVFSAPVSLRMDKKESENIDLILFNKEESIVQLLSSHHQNKRILANISHFSTLFIISSLSRDSLTIDLTFPKPVINEKNGIYSITMLGTISLGKPGEPVLPVKAVRVLLPSGKTVDSYDIITGKKVTFPSSYLLEHGQKEYPLFPGVEAEETPRNESIYEQDKFFPKDIVVGFSLQHAKGYHLGIFSLVPIQYLPKEKKVSYFQNLKLIIYLKKAEGTIIRNNKKDREFILKHVDNPLSIITYIKKTSATESKLPDGEFAYVIITSPEFEQTFQRLRDYRIQQGLNAKIVTTEFIYNNYDGTRPDGLTDNQTKIRNFIIDAYHNWGTQFVLLGGDADGADVGGESGDNIVPVRLLWGSFFRRLIPGDSYYANLDGSFDENRNGIYGERDDGSDGGEIDLYAEVMVGRAPVDSIEEVKNFVNKTLTYQKDRSNYLKKVLFVGEYMGWGGEADFGKNSMEEIRKGSIKHGIHTSGFESSIYYTTETLYEKDQIWTDKEIINRINDQPHIINHEGHGSLLWNMKLCHAPYGEEGIFCSESGDRDVDNFTNTKPFILYSQACFLGAFDNKEASFGDIVGGTGKYAKSDAISEHFLTDKHGAVAVIGNSREGIGEALSTEGPSQIFNRIFWDTALNEGGTIGEIHHISKENTLPYWYSAGMRNIYLNLNLLGDPALPLRTGPPGIILNIEYPGKHYYLNGTVSIQGTIAGKNFNSFQLTAIQETESKKITDRVDHRIESGTLAEWDTTQIPDGKTVILINITDTSGMPFSVDLPVIIDNINEPPVVELENKKAFVGVYSSFNISAVDPDKPGLERSSLSFHPILIPEGSSLIGNLFSWIPTESDVGPHEAIFEITDNENSVTRSINISVIDAKNIPVQGNSPRIYENRIVHRKGYNNLSLYDIDTKATTELTTSDSGISYHTFYDNFIVYKNTSNLILFDIIRKREKVIPEKEGILRKLSMFRHNIIYNLWNPTIYKNTLWLFDILTSQEYKISEFDTFYPSIYDNKIVYLVYQSPKSYVYMYDLGKDYQFGTHDDGGEKQLIESYIGFYQIDIYKNKLALVGIDDGQNYLYLYDLTTHTLTRLLKVPEEIRNIEMHDRFIYYQFRDYLNNNPFEFNVDIYLFDLETKQQFPLLNNTYDELNPSASARYLAYDIDIDHFAFLTFNPEKCDNQLDDDSNGCIDGTDASCGARERECYDGLDNDCDGRTDCQDHDCPNDCECSMDECSPENLCVISSYSGMAAKGSLVNCDLNSDRLVNNDDLNLCNILENQCSSTGECGSDEICDIYCQNEDQGNFGICVKLGQEICNNGMDDDNDGLIDCLDPACPECYCKQTNEQICSSTDMCSINKCYGEKAQGQCYKCDLIQDTQINIRDLSYCGAHYSYPNCQTQNECQNNEFCQPICINPTLGICLER